MNEVVIYRGAQKKIVRTPFYYHLEIIGEQINRLTICGSIVEETNGSHFQRTVEWDDLVFAVKWIGKDRLLDAQAKILQSFLQMDVTP